ncbi:MAG: 2-C-methyl-D-erythritol 4-phosphate cytidylyltransferase [Dehalococcoidia bacterium]|nr:2-C-methyl-D-erythritol 4-phosphate cytidylyltransferase [Dehalococcoidia bacterium]
MKSVGAIVVAAGTSRRMGGVDKVFANLAGKPLLAHTVDVLQRCSSIDQVVIVLSEDKLEEGRRLVKEYRWSKVTQVCPGGARRQDSVREGLERLSGCQWVVIHDGARPCLSVNLIEEGLKEARHSGAAIAAIPVTDTIKVVSPDTFIEETLPRQGLWAAQTPQVFRFDIINEAYRKAQGEATDDATLVEQLGYTVKVYPGSDTNIKVTTPEDLLLAEAILKSKERG